MKTDQNLWFIILDPTAENGLAGRKWPKIEQELQQQGFSYTVKFAENRGHLSRLADDAILNGYRKILGIGDDDTNHEICNGILQNQWAASSEILYALLPVGTSNVWAKQWKILRTVGKRLEKLKSEQTAMQNAWQVIFQKNGRPKSLFFVNEASMAHDVFIARQLENLRQPENAPPALFKTDGEFLGEVPCTFSVVEGALKICL